MLVFQIILFIATVLLFTCAAKKMNFWYSLLACLCFYFMMQIEFDKYNTPSKYPKYTDVPEYEWNSISDNKSKPDTMLAYIRNDSLFITFTGKHR